MKRGRGFQVTVACRGAARRPSRPRRARLRRVLAQSSTPAGGNGGARTVPTDATVAKQRLRAAVFEARSRSCKRNIRPRGQRRSAKHDDAPSTANSPVFQQILTASPLSTAGTTVHSGNTGHAGDTSHAGDASPVWTPPPIPTRLS